jgi:hypothetical protein
VAAYRAGAAALDPDLAEAPLIEAKNRRFRRYSACHAPEWNRTFS